MIPFLGWAWVAIFFFRALHDAGAVAVECVDLLNALRLHASGPLRRLLDEEQARVPEWRADAARCVAAAATAPVLTRCKTALPLSLNWISSS